MATYFNYMIRQRLIDHLRQTSRQVNTAPDILATASDLPTFRETLASPATPNLDELIYTRFTTNHYLLDFVRTQFTCKQWLWFQQCILQDRSIAETALQNRTTPDAVRSWRLQARKKLNQPHIKSVILDEIIN